MYFWTSSSVISTFRGSADVAGGAAGCAGAADADRAGDAAVADSSAFLEEQAVGSAGEGVLCRRGPCVGPPPRSGARRPAPRPAFFCFSNPFFLKIGAPPPRG